MSLEVLGSRPKMKILSILLNVGELNITMLVKQSGLGYRTVEHHIRELQELGLVAEKRFGRIRIVELRRSDPRISSLRRFLAEWKLVSNTRM